MGKKDLTRRDLLKAGLVTAGAAVLGPAVVKPTGTWAATPKIKGPIKVGYQAIMSGALAGYGEFHKMGVTMAQEEINAAGGIAGNKLDVEFRDSGENGILFPLRICNEVILEEIHSISAVAHLIRYF